MKTWYSKGRRFNQDRYLERIVTSLFKSWSSQFAVLINQPKITRSLNKITVQVLYYTPSSPSLKINKFIFILPIALNNIILSLENSINCNTSKLEYQLKIVFIRISSPVLDPWIIAEYLQLSTQHINFQSLNNNIISILGLETIKNINLVVSNNNNIKDNSSIAVNNNLKILPFQGLTVKLAGRIHTEPVIPRKTVQTTRYGIGSNKINLYKGYNDNYSFNLGRTRLTVYTINIV